MARQRRWVLAGILRGKSFVVIGRSPDGSVMKARFLPSVGSLQWRKSKINNEVWSLAA